MNSYLTSFLKNDNVAAPITTKFLKSIGEGNMQNGLRVIYRCAERKGMIEGAMVAGATAGIIFISKNAWSKVRDILKESREDKKKVNNAILVGQKENQSDSEKEELEKI